MPANRRSHLPEPPETPVWVVLRWVAPAIILIGAVGALVGVLAGQSVGIVAVYLLGMVTGAILLLILRWR